MPDRAESQYISIHRITFSLMVNLTALLASCIVTLGGSTGAKRAPDCSSLHLSGGLGPFGVDHLHGVDQSRAEGADGVRRLPTVDKVSVTRVPCPPRLSI